MATKKKKNPTAGALTSKPVKAPTTGNVSTGVKSMVNNNPLKSVTSTPSAPSGGTGGAFTQPGFKSGPVYGPGGQQTNQIQGYNTTGNQVGQIDYNQFKSTSASVQDISKKYGIDYSQEYAKRQAEAEVQAKRSGLQNQLSQTDLAVKNANDQIDRDYFQKGLAQAQANVNGGINDGLANESNLRLGMSRQAEMADMQREAMNQRTNINQELTDLESSAKVRQEQIYQERLQQAIALIQQDRSLDQADKSMLLNAMLTQRGQDIDQSQFAQNLDWSKYQFNNMSATDRAQLDWSKYQFNNMSATDLAQLDWSKYQFNNMSAAERAQLDWSKYQFGNISATDQANLDWSKYQFGNISAQDKEANKLAWAQLEEQKRQFNSESEWRKYTFNNMSAAEKAQFEMDKSQFGEEMAWKKYELEYTSEMALAQSQAQYGDSGLGFLP